MLLRGDVDTLDIGGKQIIAYEFDIAILVELRP